jgi:hypothetical protein
MNTAIIVFMAVVFIMMMATAGAVSTRHREGGQGGRERASPLTHRLLNLELS